MNFDIISVKGGKIMNHLDTLQNGIDYIESHLADEISNEEISAVTRMSIVHFQKAFLGITGLTLGEYIRNRRLTLAATELAGGKNTVLQIALKYGYESSEGFSRAFREFHGVNPNVIKTGKGRFYLFNKITLEIKVNGGNKMNFEITELKNKSLAGIRTIASGNMNKDIDKRWDNDDEAWETTRRQQNELLTDDHIWYEVYRKKDDDTYLHYICSGCDEIPTGCERVNFEGGLYAKITTERCKYPTEQLKGAYYSSLIDNQWLEDAGFELDDKRNQLYVTNWTMIEKEERFIEIYLPVNKIDGIH